VFSEVINLPKSIHKVEDKSQGGNEFDVGAASSVHVSDEAVSSQGSGSRLDVLLDKIAI
jgi:hypothetical protein